MSKRSSLDLTIVIPALREEKRIGSTLRELAKYLSELDLNVEVILVAADGGDKTVEVAVKSALNLTDFKVINPGKPVGKGRDVREGMLKAKGSAVLFMDADLATPLKYIEEFYQHFQNRADVVIGVRNLKKHHRNIVRRSISMSGNFAFGLFGGVWVEDSQCGFKLFSAEASKVCFEKLTILKWGFDMELLAIAKYHGFDIKSVRVEDWRHVSGGSFGKAPVKNIIESVRDLGHIFLNRLKGRYR